jgi:UDPglucose 6-dehydrogenase
VTNAKSAELIKHACNAFLAMKISYINMVANLAEAVGADIDQVCAGLGSDRRIGPEFLRAGIGYGGSCFPKDVSAFQSVATQCGVDFSLLAEVTRINELQRHRFVKKVRAALWTLRAKRMGVLGLAFKGGTDDVRESPAIAIVQQLLKEGASICAFDPAAMSRARKLLPPGEIDYAGDEYQAAEHADALLLLTDWPRFAKLDLTKLRSVMKLPIIIDGRNLLVPNQVAAAGFLYYSVGRPLPSTESFVSPSRYAYQASQGHSLPAAGVGLPA